MHKTIQQTNAIKVNILNQLILIYNMDIVEKISNNKQYRDIYVDTIERVVKELINKGYSEKEIEKETKRILYKNNIAFFKRIKFEEMLKDFKESLSKEMHLKWLKKYDPNRVLSLDGLYEDIFKLTGKPKTIIDIGCGLNPLTLPWMNLEKDTMYIGYDINKRLIWFLNKYFELIKRPYKAILNDVLIKVPEQKADVAFLFKTTTCFSWQDKSSINRVLNGLNVNYAVISLALRDKKDAYKARNYFNKIVDKGIVGEIVKEKEFFIVVEIKQR